MLLSLCACGGGTADKEDTGSATQTETNTTDTPEQGTEEPTITKELLLETAVEADINQITNETPSNVVKAQSTWCDQDLVIEGCIWEIKADYVLLYDAGASDVVLFEVYLPADEIKELSSSQIITIVGHTDADITEVEQSLMGMSYTTYRYIMKTAFLVSDRFEIDCVLKGVNNDFAPAYNVQVGQSSYLQLVYFDESVDTSKLPFDQNITISAKLFYSNPVYKRTEAIIVK